MIDLDTCNIGDILISKGLKSFIYGGKFVSSYLVRSKNDYTSLRTKTGHVFEDELSDDDIIMKLDDMTILERLIYLTHNEILYWYDAGNDTYKAFNNGIQIRFEVDGINFKLKIDSQYYGNNLNDGENMELLYSEMLPRIHGRVVDLFFDGIKY